MRSKINSYLAELTEEDFSHSIRKIHSNHFAHSKYTGNSIHQVCWLIRATHFATSTTMPANVQREPALQHHIVLSSTLFYLPFLLACDASILFDTYIFLEESLFLSLGSFT